MHTCLHFSWDNISSNTMQMLWSKLSPNPLINIVSLKFTHSEWLPNFFQPIWVQKNQVKYTFKHFCVSIGSGASNAALYTKVDQKQRHGYLVQILRIIWSINHNPRFVAENLFKPFVVWPNLTKFYHFGQIFKAFRQILMVLQYLTKCWTKLFRQLRTF